MKKYKGDFGYIAYRKKITTIRTIICLAVSVGIFLIGLAINGTQKNVFSIIAALGCLPAGWSAVNMIMFLKAKACSDDVHREIEAHRGPEPASSRKVIMTTFHPQILTTTA